MADINKEVFSKYALELPPSDFERYKEKLTITVGSEVLGIPDPYTLSSGWLEDPTSLPPVDYPCIYSYLINTPGPFTGEALKAYKSLEAYNYFLSGHVRDVCMHNVSDSSPLAIIKGFVRPGQHMSQQHFQPWVAVNKKHGYVSSAHCTCMAGLGEACSHIASILFTMEAVTSQGLNNAPACTSVKGIWQNYYRDKVVPCTSTLLDFSHPTHGKTLRKHRSTTKTKPRAPQLSDAEAKAALQSLRDILPSAAACIKGDSDTDTASEDEQIDLPMTPLRLARVHEGLKLDKAVEAILSDAKEILPQQVINLASATEEQRHSALWRAHRCGRVTASMVHSVVHCREPRSALRQVMQYDKKDISNVPAVKWGIEKEDLAKKQLCKYMEQRHDGFQFEETGLVLFQQFPFLAASPDGLINCKCHGTSIVEIKCPYSCRELAPTLVGPVQMPYLDSNGNLKTGHKFYSQVQTQMLVCSCEQSYFVLWNPQFFEIQIIKKDHKFCSELLASVKSFVCKELIPELVTKRLQFASNSDQFDGSNTAVYCSCKRPPFGNMISCSNPDCETEWYHYECIGMRRKPRGQWFCSNCKP